MKKSSRGTFFKLTPGNMRSLLRSCFTDIGDEVILTQSNAGWRKRIIASMKTELGDFSVGWRPSTTGKIERIGGSLVQRLYGTYATIRASSAMTVNDIILFHRMPDRSKSTNTKA